MQERYTDIIDFNKETSQIMNKLKCLTVEQFLEFFPENPKNLRDYAMKSVYYFAQNFHTILIQHKEILINANNPEYRQDMIDCIWVMLDMFNNSENEFGSVLCNKKCQDAETPCNIVFFDNNKFFKLVHIANKNELTKCHYSRDLFYNNGEGKHGKEDEGFAKYIFVIRDEALLEEIASFDLQIPHVIALLSGEDTKKPTIKYFE